MRCGTACRCRSRYLTDWYDVRARDLSVEVAKAKAVGADLLMPITRVQRRHPHHPRDGEAELVADGHHQPRQSRSLREGVHRRARKIRRRLHVLRALVRSDQEARALRSPIASSARAATARPERRLCI